MLNLNINSKYWTQLVYIQKTESIALSHDFPEIVTTVEVDLKQYRK